MLRPTCQSRGSARCHGGAAIIWPLRQQSPRGTWAPDTAVLRHVSLKLDPCVHITFFYSKHITGVHSMMREAIDAFLCQPYPGTH